MKTVVTMAFFLTVASIAQATPFGTCAKSLDPKHPPSGAEITTHGWTQAIIKEIARVRQEAKSIPELKDFLIKIKPCENIGNQELKTYVKEIERSAKATVNNAAMKSAEENSGDGAR